jgi:hypothetical protein
MRRILQLCMAFGATLMSTTSLNAQSNSTLRPGTDSSVTTGIGSNSTFRNVPPPPGQPPPDTSRSVFWYMPDAYEKPQDRAKEDKEPDKAAAPPSPAAEVPEDPRTMITRDRIESPQH